MRDLGLREAVLGEQLVLPALGPVRVDLLPVAVEFEQLDPAAQSLVSDLEGLSPDALVEAEGGPKSVGADITKPEEDVPDAAGRVLVASDQHLLVDVTAAVVERELAHILAQKVLGATVQLFVSFVEGLLVRFLLRSLLEEVFLALDIAKAWKNLGGLRRQGGDDLRQGFVEHRAQTVGLDRDGALLLAGRADGCRHDTCSDRAARQEVVAARWFQQETA
mmetsp:Transcript_116027/g.324517  ORF Transcript_116027/g.324517 Transcript_116027/m.324517 type:complete len:220 (-) Transcript_116027:8-667(-)